ncbi:MAG: DUF4469 domain-containing protein [Tannerella sp.]|jgi:hypothetical protein|nr:DUF4469 domain-containing protein [Tannerella sp.]
MAKKFFWKVWLRLNKFTKEVLNDYIAEVSTAGDTKRNEDIAKAIKDEGSDLQYETLIDVLNRSDRWKRRFVLEGSSVQDGNVHMQPRVPGNWEGADPHYDPKKHRPTIDAFPTADMRRALEEEVGVEVLGKKVDGGAIIGLVTDVMTGRTDGAISTGGDLIITGSKIRIEPIDDKDLGIFFVSPAGPEVPVEHPLTQNDPKRIICRVPALPASLYTLKIVTRYANGSILLKEPRTIIYELPLTVVS